MKINHIWIPVPDNCLICSAPISEAGKRARLCRACEEELPWQPPGCSCCAIVLKDEDGARQCARCLHDPPEFDSCHVLFEYCPPVQDLIGAFKYRQRFAAGRMMAGLLAESFLRHHEAAPPPRLLIPVPMHPRRLRWRGFNQALELVRHISRLSGVPAAPELCVRNAATPPQRGLTAAERAQNLYGVFSVTDPASIPAHIAIVDDVVTTTATVNELARTLRQAGALRIEVWALARVNQP